MKIDTARLKASVDIVDIIGRKITLTKKGSEYVGICPFHSDNDPSLHVNSSKQLFFCPVCGDKKGDVIDFLIACGYSFKEAAEVLHGGPIDKPAPERREIPKRIKQTVWTQVKPSAQTPKPVFTHYKFGEPSRIWEYKDADGLLLGYTCRFNHADGSKDILPFIYATDGKRYGWRYQGFDRPRPLYNLDKVVGADVVIVVEGEKTADAIFVQLPTHVVTCWTGGTNAVHLTDLTPLEGKTIIFWPDNDAPGRKAMKFISDALTGKIKAAKFVHVDPSLSKGWDGADVDWQDDELRLWLRQNMHDIIWPEDVQTNTNENTQTHTVGVQSQAEENVNTSEAGVREGDRQIRSDTPTDRQNDNEDLPKVESNARPTTKREDPTDNPYFKVLGFETDDDGAKYIFFSKRLNCIIRSGIGGLTKNFFAQLAPQTFWDLYFEDAKPEHLVQWVVDACGSRLVFNDADIRGRGAWFDKGRAILHVGNQLFVDGEPVSLGDLETDYIYSVGQKMNIEPCEPLSEKEAKKFPALLRRLKWERGINADLLAGWCVVAPICGALDWRPHIWVTGPAGTGKSWVFENVVSRIVGNIALRVQGDTTEAGVRQSLGHDARPVIFDESEAEDRKSQDRVQSVLALMRGASTSDGGLTIKGSATGSAKTYQIRSCFAFASIGVPISQQSDRSRVTMLTLAKPGISGDDWDTFVSDFMITITDEYIDALRSRTIRMIPTIKKNAKTFAKACAIVLGSQRAGDQAGALLAGAYALESDGLISFDEALAFVKRHDWNEEQGHDNTRDEIRLFNHLMDQLVKIEANGVFERNIGELVLIANNRILDHLTAEVAQKRLGRLGFRIEGEHLAISNSADQISKFLSNTTWAKNHNKILLRIEGSINMEPTRFASGVKTRAVGVPLKLLY